MQNLNRYLHILISTYLLDLQGPVPRNKPIEQPGVSAPLP